MLEKYLAVLQTDTERNNSDTLMLIEDFIQKVCQYLLTLMILDALVPLLKLKSFSFHGRKNVFGTT